MSSRVLLTGSNGALGRVVVARLSMNPAFIVSALARTEGEMRLDVRQPDQIELILENTHPDLILHLAATFSNDFDEAFAINVAAAKRILDSVEASGRPTRVVLIGSAAEYGAVSPDENPITEDHAPRPVSVYGLTKSWQTELAYLYASRGVDVVVARIFNLIGPGMSERLFVGRIQKQIAEILRGERMRIEVGPLSAIRDYLTVDDAVSQLLAIAELGQSGQIYHIASGQPVVMRNLLAKELAAANIPQFQVIENQSLSNRKGYDVPSIYADISKTAALLKQQEAHATH
jgi:nucleoside-diphosphate-sugar epimerase